MHDTIAQGLTGVIAQLQAASATPTASAPTPTSGGRPGSPGRASARPAAPSGNLGPAALEHDTLPEALRKTVADWAERSGVDTRFTVTGTSCPSTTRSPPPSCGSRRRPCPTPPATPAPPGPASPCPT
ncbi:hypothetical protein [Streptomyces narbonensis]